MKPYAIHWFRRDLRVAGNLALQRNYKDFEGRVLGIFCFDKKFLSRDDFSVNRFQFFLETLKSLRDELREMGGDLLVLDEGPVEAFEMLFRNLDTPPTKITWSRDYEPFARERDKKLEKLFKDNYIQTESFRDHLIIEPQELKKTSDDEPYKVYTPFSRRWLEIFEDEAVKHRVNIQKNGITHMRKVYRSDKLDKIFSLSWKKLMGNKLLKDHLDDYINSNSKKTTVEIPESGTRAAFSKLKAFKRKVDEYAQDRDIPQLEATSGLSVFLKNGSLTTAQVIYYLGLETYDVKKKSSRDTFFSELIWREFYYHVMYHFPDSETEEFNDKYSGLEWENDKKLFEAWKEGKTGFPIVDAGMRQLKTTGLMHNRVRMIVASFLTKDLLIDWRWGEKYFMDQLLDGDLAANNGGWQWAASTGCDAQPYFRIFNPWSQSKKFDPDGKYIKTYIPELENVEAKKLHKPIEDHDEYPAPIVEHSEQRERALDMYKRSIT